MDEKSPRSEFMMAACLAVSSSGVGRETLQPLSYGVVGFLPLFNVKK